MQSQIKIDITTQQLLLCDGDKPYRQWPVSTAKNGTGEQQDSECTPRGRHLIAKKIGGGCEINTVFVGRVPTGEIYSPELKQRFPERDWILTRILWLAGIEPGKNQGGTVDSKARYIYIHGAPDDVVFTTPGSKGCIRMRNQHIIDLFEHVAVGTPVDIRE